jgi:AraC-like DNA-binding protein
MGELIRRQEYTTADPARVAQILGWAHGTKARLLGVAPGAAVRLVRHDAGYFSISETSVVGVFRYACEPGEAVSVTELTTGHLKLTCGHGGERLAAARPILGARRGAPQVFQACDARIRQLTIGRGLVDSMAATTGPASIEFRELQPPTDGLADLWRRTAGYVAHIVTSPSGVAGPLLLATAHTVAAALLTCFPHTVRTPRDGLADATPSAELLRRALAFVDENARRDIGIGEIAHAVHVTPRTVQLTFRRYLATTPTGYLRQVRLEGAHSDLTHADPASTTVAEIAARWGFGHAGRFSALYRRRYGCGPSTTLNGG